jgi:hypothetical protein
MPVDLEYFSHTAVDGGWWMSALGVGREEGRWIMDGGRELASMPVDLEKFCRCRLVN